MYGAENAQTARLPVNDRETARIATELVEAFGGQEVPDFSSCHTINKSGIPVQGMRKFAATADGKYLSTDEIQNLVNELSQKAEAIYQEIRKMDFEHLKSKVMLQECYQLKIMFDFTGIDWQPTEEMKNRIEGKSLLDGILPRGKMITDIDEYKELFGIKLFAQEVLGEQV